MRKSLPLLVAVLVVIGFSVAGLTRLRFETDILDVLPGNLPSVKALKVSQKHFDNDQRVALLLQGDGEEIYEEDVAEFVEQMREKLSPAKVLYKSELEEDPAAFGQALADIWRYAPQEDVAELVERMTDEEKLKAHLEEVKGEIRRSFDQQESTMAAYDPLGFLKHPGMEEFIGSELAFQSEDGMLWIVLIENPEPTTDYHKHAAWLEKIRAAANGWDGLEELGLSYGLTGGPVYNAEIGAGMEKDMSGTITMTCVAIGLLFLLIQRHPGQLVMISLLLGLTFLITLGIGGWVFGALNLVSVGFAAILLGLVIDYGVVISREAAGGIASSGTLRREMAPAVGWAALTTAIVFGLLTLSTFNGVRQLGGLIVIGLVAGAGVMLVFMPMFLGKFHGKEARVFLEPPFPGRKAAAGVMVACGLLAIGVFVTKGEPDVSFDFSMVEPSSSEAAATFTKIQEKFPAWSDRNLQVIAEGSDWGDLRGAAEDLREKLKKLKEEGVIETYTLPVEFIPYQTGDADESLKKIAAKRDEILETLKAAGFSEAGIALDGMVLEGFLKAPSPINELTKHFVVEATSDHRAFLSGSILVADEVTVENAAALKPLSSWKYNVTGWSVIQAALLPSVKRDFYVIFLPATAVLLLTLVIVFRSVRDAAISILVLVAALALVNAFVAGTGRSWNFLSGMAIPLIVGTGIDYSIHLIFALRRSEGDFKKVWNGVGKAICFCGLSTAVGFGSLMFASNEMLRSMGLLCSMGVLLTTLLSVLVVPGLWKRNRA
ncbi:MAG: MMPL family transporter [Akkermansiaceae bacterium]|nr:MMPL family transporter [Akkermansiaceae bacterium]